MGYNKIETINKKVLAVYFQYTAHEIVQLLLYLHVSSGFIYKYDIVRMAYSYIITHLLPQI